MAIDQKYIDLINADIDGILDDGDRAELDAFLAENAEGQALRDELASLCGALDAVEEETPPPHLKHVIMNSIKAPKAPAPEQSSPGFLEALFATPALKYAATFAAGVVLTMTLLDSGQIANRSFDDMTDMVGTVGTPTGASHAETITVNKAAVSGKVSLHSMESLLILDFDLVSKDPLEIEANYTDQTIWFNGFAQLESDGTTVSAENGRVTLGMEGKRRYAVYLHNSRGRGTTVNLRFVAGDQVVHEASLAYAPGE